MIFSTGTTLFGVFADANCQEVWAPEDTLDCVLAGLLWPSVGGMRLFCNDDAGRQQNNTLAKRLRAGIDEGAPFGV
jgi:hypothetical protein